LTPAHRIVLYLFFRYCAPEEQIKATSAVPKRGIGRHCQSIIAAFGKHSEENKATAVYCTLYW
jgi:hypothetical protein